MSVLDRFRPTKIRPDFRFAPGENVVDIQDVSVAMEGKNILDGVSLQVKAGEVLALVGPNGAGKSTLLAAISGDVPLASGAIVCAGKPLSSWTASEIALFRAVLLQQITLSFPFTVREVVEMGRSPWANLSTDEEDLRIIAESLSATDVTAFEYRYFNSLSGGEKARVALARILAQAAPVLLLDEPTAALDIKHQEQVLSIARAKAAENAAVVVVLHDLNLALGYADRTAVLSEGKIAAVGKTDDVLTSDLLTSVYQYHVDVFDHPNGRSRVILPQRNAEG